MNDFCRFVVAHIDGYITQQPCTAQRPFCIKLTEGPYYQRRQMVFEGFQMKNKNNNS